MPAKLAPMLAEIGDAPFHRADWMWEPKLDGYRVLAFIDETRRQAALAARARACAEVPAPRRGACDSRRADGMILDGELVAFDATGKPSFGALQDRAQLKTEREIAAADQTMPVVFYCFDLLYFAGIDLRKSPYRDRRRYLAQCLLPSPLVQLVHAAEDGVALQRRRARERLRRRGRQAQGQPLRGRPPLDVVAQGQADDERGFRRRRLHARQGLARAARRAARRLLGRQEQAALRVARRLGLRRAHADAGQDAARAAASARPARSPKSRSSMRRRRGSSPRPSPK